MAQEPSAWSAYVTAVMRIEAPGGVFWVRPAPQASTAGEYPDPEGHPIYVLTAHNPGGQVACTDQRVTVTGWSSELDTDPLKHDLEPYFDASHAENLHGS